MVILNLPIARRPPRILGGQKASSYGSREPGACAREFYTTVKTAYVAP
jgi:aldehyde dehydrogenase (NAD+)